MRYERRSLLDGRSVIVAVVVFLIGAAIGFGVGYKYEKHSVASKSTSAPRTTTTVVLNDASTSKVARLKHAYLVLCMAKLGVKYPSPLSDTSKPPAGVAQAKYELALAACSQGS